MQIKFSGSRLLDFRESLGQTIKRRFQPFEEERVQNERWFLPSSRLLIREVFFVSIDTCLNLFPPGRWWLLETAFGGGGDNWGAAPIRAVAGDCGVQLAGGGGDSDGEAPIRAVACDGGRQLAGGGGDSGGGAPLRAVAGDGGGQLAGGGSYSGGEAPLRAVVAGDGGRQLGGGGDSGGEALLRTVVGHGRTDCWGEKVIYFQVRIILVFLQRRVNIFILFVL